MTDQDNGDISLARAFEVAALRPIARGLLADYRKIRPSLMRLSGDVLDAVPVSLDLDSYLHALRRRVLSGSYAPAAPAVVTVAKRNSLLRPVVYPCLDDAIVLGALMAAIKPKLDEELPDWVSYGGKPSTKKPGNEEEGDEYEDWFGAFLRHKARADRIRNNDDPLIVSTDISNFFPSIRLDLLRDRIRSLRLLDTAAVNLLFELLRRLGSASLYDPFMTRGLPQEPDDHARLLAAYFLKELDSTVEPLGKAKRYARFADDILFSARDQRDATKILLQVQRTLQPLGLNLNSSKTRILTTEEFEAYHFPTYNAYLDGLDDPLVGKLFARDLDEKTRLFLRETRTGEWDRVLRRFYSLSRRYGSVVLAPYALRHIREFPESAAYALEYLQAMRPTEHTAVSLVDIAQDTEAIHEDVRLKSYTTLLHLPLPNRQRLRDEITRRTETYLKRKARLADPLGDQLALLVAYRYAKTEDALRIARNYVKSPQADSPGVKQAYVLLRAEGKQMESLRGLLHDIHDPELWRAEDLFQRIEHDGDATFQAMEPWLRLVEIKGPDRFVARARALPLIRFFAKTYRSPRYISFVEEMTQTLKGAQRPAPLDALSIRRIGELSTT